MPTIAPPQVVTGAPRIALPFGLFSVLAPREGSADRWENGVLWETLTCDPLNGLGQQICPVNEVQSITLGGAGLTSYTLTFSGQETAAIAAAATASAIQTALEALSNIAPGDVIVTGPNGGPFSVEFTGTLAGDNVPQMTATPTGGTGTVTIATVTVGESTLGLPKVLTANAGEYGDASPFAVYGHYTCSPIGNSYEDAAAKAQAQLLAREEARVEQALWTGNLGQVPNFAGANGYPALTAVDSFPLASAWSAVAALEQEIAEAYGSLGVLHMSREVATILFDDGQLRTQGARIFTPLGTPVVAGTGYDSTKIVATPALFGYRSEIITSSDVPYDLLDRAQNNLYAIAERVYVLGFDPCGAASATLTTEGE